MSISDKEEVVQVDTPTDEASTVTQQDQEKQDTEVKRSTLQKAFGHPVFPMILMVLAGVAIAFQAGKIREGIYVCISVLSIYRL